VRGADKKPSEGQGAPKEVLHVTGLPYSRPKAIRTFGIDGGGTIRE